jgi:Cu/Ag efflux pump CusA
MNDTAILVIENSLKYPSHETLMMQFKLDVITGIRQPIRKPFFILLVIVLSLLELMNLEKIGNAIKMMSKSNSQRLNNIGLGV